MLVLEPIINGKEDTMVEKIKKPIKDVSINYEDKTHDKVEYYALVGFDGDTWFSVLYAPPKTADQITMNNMLVDLSKGILKSIK